MSGNYQLNRQIITGKLNEFTPSCVVCEILKSHSICVVKEINSLPELLTEIKRVESYRTLTVKEPFSDRDLRYLATYVNADCATWTKSSLVKSYEHLMSFDIKNTENIVYGQKSYETPLVYNACMLYAVCKHYGIETKWNMSVNQMIFSIQNMHISLKMLKNQLNSYIEKLNKIQIINLYNNITDVSKKITKDITDVNREVNNPEVQPLLELKNTDLLQTFEKLNNTSFLLTKYNPGTHIEAIILTALLYNLNITESSIPLAEYNKIKENKNIDLYIPVDEKFRVRYLRNPLWYDTDITWEPKLQCIYTQESLKKLCLNEGYQIEDFRGYGFESLLQITRISFNVFFGKNIYPEEDYTPILLEEVDDLSNNECVTLGNIDTKELRTFSLNELSEHFTNYKDYKNPLKINELLDKRVINKLKLYSVNCNHAKLQGVFKEVDKWKEYSTEVTEKLRTCYSENPSISNFLNKIVECGMYMRGWKVSNDAYPVASKHTNFKEDHQFKIESNVHTSIDEVFTVLESYSEETRRVLSELPLLKYTLNEKSGEYSFIVSPDPEDGKSITERLKIVKGGDKYKNMKSCIRVSSNIILSSVYFYICSLGMYEPFRISDLDYIS